MSWENYLEILGGIGIILSIVLGVKFRQARRLGKEIAEALVEFAKVIDDNDASKSDFRKLRKEFADVVEAARALFGR